MKRWLGSIAALVIVTAMLAGCAAAPAASPSVSDSNNGQSNVNNTSEAGATDTGVWPRTITDAVGHEIVLQERPERVVVLHPLYLDYFLALDTPPVASGNAKSALEEFATLEPYRGTVEIADLGSGRDLNLEAVIAANPDVIVTFKGHVDANYDELSKIAPVVQIDYGWPRTITDAVGHEIVLQERPERVVVLHPLYLDYFLALDTPPVASGNAKSALEEFATLEPYRGTVEIADLGSGRDLNLEAVIAANPDVIVTFKGHVDANYDELSKIAPVVQIDYGDTWENATMLCAQVIGKESLAEQLINDTKETIAKTKEQMSGVKGKSFALLRVDGKANFTAQGAKNTVYYNDVTGFGLLKPEGYPEEGQVLSLEALSAMNPDYIIIQHDLKTAQAAVQEKEAMDVWKSLTAVKENHVLFFDNSLNSGSILAIRLAAENFMKLAGQ